MEVEPSPSAGQVPPGFDDGVSAATAELAATAVSDSRRVSLPRSVSPINHTPAEVMPVPVSAPLHPQPNPAPSPLPISEPPLEAARSPQGSPRTRARGRPPVFHPERAQQLPPGEEEGNESGAAQPEGHVADVEMRESVEPGHPLADPASVAAAVAANPPPPTPATSLTMPGTMTYDPRMRRVREDFFAVHPRVPAAYMFKHLGDKLAGVIMGCTDETKNECLNDEVFGLPEKHWDYLQHVKEGVTFYLFNYSRRSLHGIFKSVEPAQWQLKPHGWCPSQHMLTHFPAQIRVKRTDEFPCLMESEYRPILEWKNNYVENTSKFSFELDAEQVEALNRLFENTKETDPNRQEPPIAIRPQNNGYGMRGFMPQRFFDRRVYGYGYGYGGNRGRGRGNPYRRGGSYNQRGGMPGRGGPRGRGPRMGTTHPLAQTAPSRVARGPPVLPPPRTAQTPSSRASPAPPGMGGGPSPAMRSASGLPVRPSAAATPQSITPPPGM